GISFCGWGFGVAVGDYDNDGWEDIYITGLNGAVLYHNNHDGTFTDVTAKAGVGNAGRWGTSAAFGDYDNDGNLDLYVANHVDLDGCLDLYISDDSSPSMLYHGDCKGGFTEVGVEAGVAYSADGREQAGMGVDSADYDNDGWPDIAKANFSDDTNNLFHNDHTGEFTDLAGPANFGP